MVDIFKSKRTILQAEILRFLMIQAGKSFTQNALAKHLKVSPTAIAKSLKGIEDSIILSKDKESKRISITLNTHDRNIIHLKRVENLRNIYESGLYGYLSDIFPGNLIILFGSYAYGEDTINSDIDIAVIGYEKRAKFEKFEKILFRKISVNFYESLNKINPFLRSNILNGILLEGSVDETI